MPTPLTIARPSTRIPLCNEAYCPECNGFGVFYSDRLARDIACFDCSGSGIVTDDLAVDCADMGDECYCAPIALCDVRRDAVRGVWL
jgi:hypothetical protein